MVLQIAKWLAQSDQKGEMEVKRMAGTYFRRMRSSLVVRASDCQCTSCNGPGFGPSIRRHSGI